MMTPSVSRWVASWPMPFTIDMAIERITSMRHAATERRALPCVVERRLDAALLGWIAVTRSGAEDHRAMLGYWMGDIHQGHGYMREAAPAAVKSAFRLFDVDVIEAAAQPGNVASLAVLRGCGMAQVGERAIYAPARARNELCLVHEVARTSIQIPET
ncbi:GNAT family N-acetyltransferase [Lichenicola cladoniae]|uniref:GNAT family N-acetyltransferase n=1 Tax=Lichenicola cladoniae TaxID=1484109 RepID=UPI001EF41B40|nr:GNAT family N-acetyltransferase [Lichenicola cladoniae]